MVEGLQLAAKFVLPAYRNGSCGTGELPEKQLVKCITEGNCKGVRNEFSKLATMYPYLETIRTILGYSSPFHPDVVRAYWLGSDNLSKAEPKHFEQLLDNLVSQGFPEGQLDEVRKIAPSTFVPTHLYPVLLSRLLGPGSLEDLSSVNDCMVRWGVINSIKEEKALVAPLSLVNENGNLKTGRIETDVGFDSKLLETELKEGDEVAIHLKWVSKKISPMESISLLKWTLEVLRAYNNGG